MSEGNFTDKLAILLGEFERSPLRVIHVRRGGLEIHLSKDPVQARGTSAPRQSRVSKADAVVGTIEASPRREPAAQTVPTAVPQGTAVVTAPNIGTFYRSPKPGSPPYVEIGQRVAAGEELCLVEVMKLFTAVRSDFTGTIAAILVEDGAMVEAGQPLFAIEET